MKKFTWRQLFVLLTVFGLVAGACTKAEDDDVAAEGDTTEAPEATEAPATTAAPDDGGEEAAATTEAMDEDAPLTASFRGVTEDTITIGFSMLDFPWLVENGFSTEGWGDQILVYQTYIDEINARGGINGRMLEGVFEYYQPIGTVDAEAKCLALTQDVETFAVIGGFLGPAEPANSCIPGTGETILIGGRVTPDRLAEANAPWIQPDATRGAQTEGLIRLLDQEGMIEGKSIALVIGTQGQDDADLARETLADVGANVVLDVNNDAPVGDIPAENASWEVLAQQIVASGADVVLSVGGATDSVRGVSLNGLDVELWIADRASLESLGSSVIPADAEGVITTDNLSEDEAWNEEGTMRCREIFAAANPDIEVVDPIDITDGTEKYFTSIQNYCGWMTIFEQIATAAGPDLTHDSFQAAMEGLGEFSYASAPFASLAPGKVYANDAIRLATFDSTLGEQGALRPLTDVQNLGELLG